MTAKLIMFAVLSVMSTQLTSLISVPECVEIKSLQQSLSIDFNGYWDEAGTYNHNTYYTLNGNYLFLSMTYNSWAISTQLSETENIFVLCFESNILLCSSKWYYIDAVSNSWIVDTDAVVEDCTNIQLVEPIEPIEPLECVGIQSLQQSTDLNFNGYWDETGTYNNNPYYSLNGHGNYLFLSITYNSWIISTQLSETDTVNVLCLEANILSCSSKWYYFDAVSNSWTVDPDAVMFDCSNMANSETTEPIEQTEYEPTEQTEPIEYEPFECVGIKSLQPSMDIDFNGYWHEFGIYNNKQYYTLNGYYLFASSKYDLWIISNELSDAGIVYIFCSETNVEACSSKWYYIDAVSNSWTADFDAATLDCDNMAISDQETTKSINIAAAKEEEVSADSDDR